MTKNKYILKSFGALPALATALALSIPGLTASAQPEARQAPQMQQQQPQQNEPDQVQQQLQQLQTELQTLDAQIQDVQSQANEDPKVRDALKNYSETLSEKMKEISPDQSDTIDRRQEIYKELLALTKDPEMSPEEQAKVQDLSQKFNSVRQELQMTEAQANQTESVQEALSEYNEVIVGEMAEIDPQIEDKIEKREEVRAEFSQLQNAILNQ